MCPWQENKPSPADSKALNENKNNDKKTIFDGDELQIFFGKYYQQKSFSLKKLFLDNVFVQKMGKDLLAVNHL